MLDHNSSKILVDVADKLSKEQSLEGITSIIAETSRKLVGADGATFVLRDDNLCYYVDEDAISPLWKGKRFPIENCISGWAMTHKQAVIVPDIYKDARIPHDAYRPTFVKSLSMVPIRINDPIGALGNYWKDSYTPTKEEMETLQVLANVSATALENYELRQSLKNSQEAQKSLISKHQELDLYIHTLIHDLRSPLTSLMGLSELLYGNLNAKDVDEKSKIYSGSLKKSAVRLNTQLEKILALYRASSNKLQKKYVDLKTIGLDVIDGMKHQFPKQQIASQIDSNLVTLADPILVRIVLENLIGNSFKFSKKDKPLELKIGKYLNNDEFSTFYVKDNGIGFEQQEAEKLFRPLGRLHADYPGLGLGLYSVSKIIRMHGGEVKAESQKSQGTTFYFSLPNAKAV